jgi:hypothetical protein
MDARILAVARAERVTSWQVLRNAGCAGASGDRWARGRSDGAQAAVGWHESKAPASGLGTNLEESGLHPSAARWIDPVSSSLMVARTITAPLQSRPGWERWERWEWWSGR